MTAASPTHYIWWLVSRASGIVAMTLVSISVLVGLAMAAKLVPARRKRGVVALHEQTAMAALVAVAVHGGSLLGDGWLRPGLAGITIPFVLHYRPAFTGAGIVAGYLAVLLGPTFYLRRRIGARTWRRLHRLTPLIWMLAAFHTLGSGSDATAIWLRCVVLLPVAPIVYLLTVRTFAGRRRHVGRRPGAQPRLGPLPVPADEAGVIAADSDYGSGTRTARRRRSAAARIRSRPSCAPFR